MTRRVDPGELEKVLDDAGVSEKTKKKVRSANGDTTPKEPRGHGAPAPAGQLTRF